MSDWILMVKGEEEKPVHPGNVENHKRAGWRIVDEALPSAESETPSDAPVAVETPPVSLPTVESMVDNSTQPPDEPKDETSEEEGKDE